MVSKRNITRIISWLAGMIIVFPVIAVPAAYFLLSYQHTTGSLETEAELNVQAISQIIGKNPEMWQYEQTRLKSFLARRPNREHREARRILDASGVTVAEQGDVLPWPTVTRSVPLFDAGAKVGSLEIVRSVRPLLMNSAVLAVCMVVLGSFVWYLVRLLPIRAIRRSEEALRKERDAAQRYLDVAGVMLVALDVDQRITMINRKGCDILGLAESEILGKNWFDAFVPEQCRAEAKAEFALLMKGLGVAETYYENPVLTAAGGERTVAWRNIVMTDRSGRPAGTLSSGEDITERKQLENQLRHAIKMEAVGLLAGGIAHDFNNILAAIIGYAGLIQMDLRRDERLSQHVEQIIAASDRAARLVKNLLAFSRKQLLDPKPVQVNDIVTDVAKLLSRLLREDIEMRLDLSEEALTIRADSGQIEQILMNLATNARDAMPNGGLFQIRTGKALLDREYVEEHGYGSPGEFACISVSDTGSGMTETVRQRIFDPFFTTKEVGKGTGLGLSVAYGIIKQHEGYISVYSEPGHGTTFKVFLPLTSSSASGERDGAALPAPGGTETVLLAEDDAVVRGMMRSVLSAAGYSVIEVKDGAEAVEAFRQYGDRVQLVLLDVIMPKMNGRLAYEAIKGRRPDVRVIFTSGYTAEIMQEEMMLAPGMHFIPKPISPRELLGKIREVLDAA